MLARATSPPYLGLGHFYPQPLACYLKRRINIVAYTGEFEFGTRHDDTRASWVIEDSEF